MIPLARVLVTGANGRLGGRLIARLAGHAPIRAVVRSASAAARVKSIHERDNVEIVVLDYEDVEALSAAAHGCSHAVHLVGIIKENATNSYAKAHEASCEALGAAAARAELGGIVYLSILGADPQSPNACLASKGRAEQLIMQARVPALVLRVPMVLGEGDPATRALEARARARIAVLLRGASLEQPIYAADVVDAIVAALARVDSAQALDLAGPESLPRAELVRRAATILGTNPRILSLPLAVGLGAAAVLERAAHDPPVTRAMLGVLDHDDRIDPHPACSVLGLDLTSLDDMLRRCFVRR